MEAVRLPPVLGWQPQAGALRWWKGQNVAGNRSHGVLGARRRQPEHRQAAALVVTMDLHLQPPLDTSCDGFNGPQGEVTSWPRRTVATTYGTRMVFSKPQW